MLVQHVRRRRGGVNRRIGTVVAVKLPEGVFVTAAKCRGIDTFDPEEGIRIAVERAKHLANGDRHPQVPLSLLGAAAHFATRAERYFKGDNVIVTEEVAAKQKRIAAEEQRKAAVAKV